jgi:hypothetical protein
MTGSWLFRRLFVKYVGHVMSNGTVLKDCESRRSFSMFQVRHSIPAFAWLDWGKSRGIPAMTACRGTDRDISNTKETCRIRFWIRPCVLLFCWTFGRSAILIFPQDYIFECFLSSSGKLPYLVSLVQAFMNILSLLICVYCVSPAVGTAPLNRRHPKVHLNNI